MAAQVNTALQIVPQSMVMAVSALVLALGMHVVLVLQNNAPVVEQVGRQTSQAAQGDSFANLAIGQETPVEAEVPERVEQAEALPPVTPEPPQEIIPTVTPPAVQLVPDVEQPLAEFETVQGGVPVVANAPALDRAEPTELTEAIAPAEEVEQTSSAERLITTEVSPEPVKQVVEPQETTQAQPLEAQSPAVMESLRPPERPVDPPMQPQPEPPELRVEKPVQKPAPTAQPRGNSQANATRGVTQSTRSASGGQATRNGGTAAVQGNAAADNYSGVVMRRIQRAKRQANVRGVALVRFKISAGGGLAGLSIARSSGSGKLDGIALAQVRRAAPFPPPPAGARTSFSIRIKGN
ncbi:MAG: hypothetical protein BM558_10170 [Roseobacter sp. MedPE-SW]|nr:MAG: hypothetical protein BM558_10170 [Roseobacter sp. MedPE-SW]